MKSLKNVLGTLAIVFAFGAAYATGASESGAPVWKNLNHPSPPGPSDCQITSCGQGAAFLCKASTGEFYQDILCLVPQTTDTYRHP